MIVGLQFYPNQKNPARASGRGVYRVVSCGGRVGDRSLRILVEPGTKASPTPGAAPILWLGTARAFKIGSRVDPLKIALDAARKRA